MSRFNKDTVLITGGVGLLGKSLVRQFLTDGAVVAVTSRRLETAQDFCESLPSDSAFPVELDVCNESSRSKTLEQIRVRTGGPPRILIANASNREAIMPRSGGPADDDFRQLMETDLIGHYRLAEMILKRSLHHEGTNIVWISSIYGTVGVDESIYPEGMSQTPVHYACTKAAIESLVRNLACTWGSTGARINAVVAGGILNPTPQDPQFINRYSARVPLRRMANADEIARPAAFLASNEASYITGSCVVVDGGYLAW